MKPKIVVLGAGFGGLELTSILSEKAGDRIDLTLIDKNNSFFFGFSKFDVIFDNVTAESVKIPYSSISKPGVKFRNENILSIDPVSRIVITDKNKYESDILVIALGADYDYNATPGLSDFGNEFYSMEGAVKMHKAVSEFKGGHAIVGVCSAPFKCPPAPSECALLLHDYLSQRGIRNDCEISLVMPFGIPIPPSPETSKALIRVFKERRIKFIPNKKVASLKGSPKTVVLDDGSEIPFDLFLGIPKHVVPEVVIGSGMTEDGWIHVEKNYLKTKFPNVYAIGDVANLGVPKAGVFSEGAAKIVAASIIAELERSGASAEYKGAGSCYIEFGEGKVGRVDVDFFSGPAPTGVHHEASEMLTEEKKDFGLSRKSRWFGL